MSFKQSGQIAGTLVFLATTVSCLAQQADTEAPEPRIATAQVDPRLRSQLHTFAPYVSMQSRLTLGQAQIGDVLEEFAKLKEYKDSTFDADPALLRASRDLVAFLVLSGDRVAPTLKAPPPLTIEINLEADPDVVFAVGMLQLFAEMAKQAALSSWQTEYDIKCRNVGKDILPLMRRVAQGTKTSERPVRVEGAFTKASWVYLQAVNESGRTLTNVTLAVKVGTIDGRTCDHYYFIPKWPAEKNKYPLRLAADWYPGAIATTSARIELISDQLVTTPISCAIDDHIPTAADLFLPEIEQQVAAKRKLKLAINRLEAIEPSLGRFPDRAKRCNEVLSRARVDLKAIVDSIDTKVSANLAEIERIKKEKAPRNYDPKKKEMRIKALRDKNTQLKAERAEWMSGER